MGVRFGMRRGLVVMLIAGLALAAGAAIAAGGLKTKKAQVSVAPGTTKSATAKCKQGTRAISGGFEAPPLASTSSAGSYVQTFTTRRTTRRAWKSTATNYFAQPDSGTLTDFAYCSGHLPKLEAKSKSRTIPDQETQSVKVRCPKGGEAVSGGFQAETHASNFTGTFPLQSRRLGNRTWKVTAYSSKPSGGATITAYAYCAKHAIGLDERSATTSFSGTHRNISAKARCKKGKQAISGGFDAPADGNSGAYVEPFKSKRARERGWKAATAAYPDSGQTVNWTVYVYCLS